MADLKPLGSEKLNGDDKLKRILELTYYNNNKKTSSSTKAELVSESKTGGVFGIVKEKDGYYVKRGLNESSLDYIGGMFMKNKNKFSSYSEAFKRLDLLKGQEELQEATKYVLKQNKPQQEAPMPEPSMDAAPAPSPEMAPEIPSEPSSDVPSLDSLPSEDGEAPMGDMGGESKKSDYMAEVQKYAGKLGQELRDLHDRMESDDIKYVLNMIISAVDLEKLDDEDIEEIGKKFDRDEEEEPTDDMGGEEIPAEEPVSADSELGEDATMDALESFINEPSPMDTQEIDLSDYSDLEHVNKPSSSDMEETKELDLDEIKQDISNSISQTLSKYFN
jgi:hypothetical protein